MQFGLIYDFRNPQPWYRPYPQLYEELFEQIEYAEELGYDSVWITEHHFVEDGYTPSVLPIAAAIATRTKRVRIGTWVLLLPLHNPLRVAEDAATVDIISNGRLDLGVGLGYRIEEFEAFGVDRRHRRRLMDEGCEIILRAWTENGWSFAGRHFNLKNVSLYPKPIQQPHPPLWIGARSAAARRAARFRSPLSLVGDKTVYDAYANALREQGEDPASYLVLGSRACYVTSDPERTWAMIRDHLHWTGSLYARWYSEAGDLPHDRERIGRMVDDPDQRRAQAVLGDAQTCIRAIEDWRSQGIPYTHMIMQATPAGIPPKDMYPYLEAFAKEVIPHFRSQVSSSARA